MGDADYVMRTNALGTLNVNEVFHTTAAEGAAIVNVASMAAHIMPEELIPTAQFPTALTDEDAFMTAMLAACDIAGDEARSGIAYAVSKSFVRWYSTSQAERFGVRGMRIVSISPGSVDTEMLVGSGFPPRMSAESVAQTLVHYALDAPLAHNGASIEMFGT
jgi:NAD(P)-dependent dehydrogenase (short-subunit alcohol dehydrogenase family)